MCGVNAKPAKGLCNLLIFNKLQSTAVGKRPQLRRDCDNKSSKNLLIKSSVGKRPQLRRDCDPFASLGDLESPASRRKETSIKKGLRLMNLIHLTPPVLVGKRPQLRRDCD